MILITGASRGIGNYLLERYYSLSKNVLGTFNNSNEGFGFAEKILSQVNICDSDSVNNWIKNLVLDDKITLINCAAINYNCYAHKSDFEKWKNVIDVNLIGTYNVIRTVLPHMRKNKFGRIINFSSVVSKKHTPGISAYAASKSALVGLTKSICIENASLGITINNINLGYSELGMIKEVPNEYKEKIISQIPKGSLCPKEDIFGCVEFIRNNSSLNGTSVDLNGGLY
tara:strand:- start:868 stop:1551 length:684 start_codon:yes stop_codon:yes gene_type:complete